jgi:serine/threonine protein kinase
MKEMIFQSEDNLLYLQKKLKFIFDFQKKTKCDGLIKIYGYSYLKKKKDYYFYEIMELAQWDWEQEINIRKKLKKYYTEKELLSITKQLIKTLSLLQKNHITHRDIKHQNILIVNGNYKLCDFGEIRAMKGSGVVVQRIRGSELFMSPILFYGLRANLIQVKHNTYKSDVFSLGMCLLYAATMHFDGTDEIRELIDMKKIRRTLEKYLKERYSDRLVNLLVKMLETNEDLRPDFEQLEKDFDKI